MKALRICLLLLLALLLPMRGAMAAAMLCPAAGPAHHGMGMQAAHAHDGAGHHGEHDHGSSSKCTMCAAFCALTPLMSDVPRLREPAALPAIGFPDESPPAPSFVSGGQDRPPRSC